MYSLCVEQKSRENKSQGNLLQGVDITMLQLLSHVNLTKCNLNA